MNARDVESQIAKIGKRELTTDEMLGLLESGGAPKRGNDMLRGAVFSPSVNVDDDYKPPSFPKSKEEVKFLTTVLQGNFLFSELSDQECNILVQAMQKETVNKDAIIIQQGDSGDFYYVVASGVVNYVLETAGNVGQCEKGGSFGELALLYDSPRAASCIAASDVVELWKVDQNTFRHVLASQAHKQQSNMKALLGKINLFKELAEADLSRFANSLTAVHWKAGARIVEKGEPGSIFYIVQEGSVKIHDIGLGDSTFEDQMLGPGDWFGERALLTGEPRAANVTAITDVTTMAMDRETFEDSIGPLKSIMEREMRLQVLRSLPVFSKGHASIEELSQMTDLMTEECFSVGDKLAIEGEPNRGSLWIIRAGRLVVHSSTNEKVYNLKNGDHFGESSVVGEPDRTSQFSAVCEENLTTWVLTREDAESVLGDVHRLELKRSEEPGAMETPILLADLKKHKILGQGAFGKVWLVSHGDAEEAYALKVINKRRILESKQLDSIIREKEFLALLQHPFILNLVASYQDKTYVYLLLPVVPGGELFSVLHKQKVKGRGLPNDNAAFYGACIIEALGHFHQRHIAYRDLKLENVLIDGKGYGKIIDLGFAKVVEGTTYTLVGTPEYLAPEIIMSKGHDVSVDYWAYGVLIYELLVGKSPFYRKGSSQLDMFKRIVLVDYKCPDYISDGAKLMLQQLLVRRPSKRLGNLANGYIDIKRQDWFEQSGIQFPAVRRKTMAAPWSPEVKNVFDAAHFDDFSAAEKQQDRTKPLTDEEQEMFVGF